MSRATGMVVAITGGIACGKSAVGAVLAEQGVEIIEADEVAHDAIAPGGPAYDEVVRQFGREILEADGQIDRARLGQRVFEDEASLARLNEFVHPPVLAAIDEWARSIRARRGLGAVIIPLLYEVGATAGWEAIICVASSPDRMLARLAARGLSAEDARRRIEAQMPVPEKARRADYVIENDGSMADLRERTLAVWGQIVNKEKAYHG